MFEANLVGRSIPRQELTLTVNESDPGVVNVTSEIDNSESERQVLALFRDTEQLNTKESIETLGIKESTAKARLRRMVDKGGLVQPNRGCYALPQDETLF